MYRYCSCWSARLVFAAYFVLLAAFCYLLSLAACWLLLAGFCLLLLVIAATATATATVMDVSIGISISIIIFSFAITTITTIPEITIIPTIMFIIISASCWHQPHCAYCHHSVSSEVIHDKFHPCPHVA